MPGELDHVSESTAPEASPLPLGFVQVDQQQTAAAARQDVWTVAGHRGSTPLLEACLADFGEATEAGDTAGIPTLIKIVADLALIERGAIRPDSRRAQQALRLGRLSLARRLITRHLSKTTLSPSMVADLLGVSVRYLHVLFESTGASFSQTVTAQRMSECQRLLCEQPPRPIAEIALACGFGSLATFYRIFSTSKGVTPGEFRAQGGTIARAELPSSEPAA
jgi:AraC-like DNA-binding protein